MSQLKDNLDEILRQKNELIIPENIKKDVEIFGVVGTLDSSGGSGGSTIVETTVEFDGLTADVEGDVLLLEDGQSQAPDINMVVAYSRDQKTTGLKWGLPKAKFSSSYVVGDTFEVGEDKITLLKDVSKLSISADLVLKSGSFNYTASNCAIAIVWGLMQEDGTLVGGDKRGAYNSDNPMAYHLDHTMTNVSAGSYFGIGHYTNATSDTYTTWAGTNLMLIEVKE